jgi:hypothetical protein
MIAGLIRQPDAAFAQFATELPASPHGRVGGALRRSGADHRPTLYGMFIPWPWMTGFFDDCRARDRRSRTRFLLLDHSLQPVALPFSLLFTALLFHFFHRLVGSGRGGWARH